MLPTRVYIDLSGSLSICYKISVVLSARGYTEFYVRNFITWHVVQLAKKLNNLVLQGIFHELIAVHQSQFDQDPGPVRLYSAWTDPDMVANFAAGVASGGQLQHHPFTLRELLGQGNRAVFGKTVNSEKGLTPSSATKVSPSLWSQWFQHVTVGRFAHITVATASRKESNRDLRWHS
jgi:hypothetical protein